ncbi:MAG: hypothetical protein P8129_09440 [Anaerolineae bacterium]
MQFHHVPHLLFPLADGEQITPDVLSLCIQPDEGMHLRFETKMPGAGMRTRSVEMEFHYGEDFEGSLPDAYERLLLDAIQGDASLFARADEIELAWGLIDPVLARWQAPGAPPLERYEPGTEGPPGAAEFFSTANRHWLNMCGEH